MTMEKVWDELDLGKNVMKCLARIRELFGIQAGVIAVFTFVIFVASSVMTWFFDIRPTLDATAVIMAFFNGDAEEPVLAPWVANVISLSLTLAPSAMQMVGVIFARDVKSFALTIIALSVFDLATDEPFVRAFLSTLPWEQLGIAQIVLYPLAWTLLLFFSSFVFETVCLCSAVVTMALVLRAMLPTRRIASSVSPIEA